MYRNKIILVCFHSITILYSFYNAINVKYMNNNFKSKNINLVFNSKPIFENFNLSIKSFEKTSIKGRSGSGKTTLFNLVMGFIKPDSGEIIFEGNLINRKTISEVRKKIAWLPQNPNIIGRGKVKEQIMLPFTFHCNKPLMPDEKTLFGEFEKLNLDKSILESSFDEISGGERQRIGIMICKLLKRDLMLLDEPTSALDKVNLGSVVKYLCAENKTTILSASHDDEWLSHCDNIIEL